MEESLEEKGKDDVPEKLRE